MRDKLRKNAVRVFTKRKAGEFRMFALPDDVVSNYVLSLGVFDKTFLNAAFALLGDRMRAGENCAVDVGAHIGNHTLQFSRRFKHVTSFEPSPILFHVLTANVLQNDIANVTLVHHGLGSVTEDRTYYRGMPGNSGNGGFVPALSGANFGTVIGVVRGDDYFRENPPPAPISLIKIDTEGFEPEVLRGLEATLDRYKPTIFFERLEGGGRDPVGVLKGYGYRTFLVLAKHGHLRPTFSFEPLPDDSRPYANVVALP